MQGYVDLCSLDRKRTTMLRGIGILLVLLGHTGYVEWGGAGGVVIFLILSGYGIDRSCESGGLRDFWRKRFLAVWLPYALASLYHIAANHVKDPMSIICTIIGADFNLGLLADKTMWYISYVMFWYFAYYIIACAVSFIRKPAIRQAARCVSLLAAAYGFRELCILGFWSSGSLAWLYHFAFPIGVILSSLTMVRVKKTVFTDSWLVLFIGSTLYTIGAYANEYSLKSAMAMGLLFVAAVQLLTSVGPAEEILLWFGKYSYPLYLFEGMVLEKRNYWFGKLENQMLIDLVFILFSCLLAAVFWDGIYLKIRKQLIIKENNP